MSVWSAAAACFGSSAWKAAGTGLMLSGLVLAGLRIWYLENKAEERQSRLEMLQAVNRRQQESLELYKLEQEENEQKLLDFAHRERELERQLGQRQKLLHAKNTAQDWKNQEIPQEILLLFAR